jgi:guanylate kinase
LRRRGDREESIVRRLAKADDEEAAGRALADHVIVNEDLEQAIDEAVGILDTHRA